MMRLLHTSDWHLGSSLNNNSRKDEMEAFFAFLRKTIIDRKIDTLIIAGDIYDTMNPNNEAETMYYSFLASILDTPCSDIIVIAGNHDSPSKLVSSSPILKKLHVHVFSSVKDLEPLVLENKAIILPVSFPRDQEIRSIKEGESINDSEDRVKKNIASLYSSLVEKAKKLNENLPLIATGHLAVENALLGEEKKNDLYIGGLGVVSSSIFSPLISYTALGHIHKPQGLNSNNTIRYSGSPIPMSFGEVGYKKTVTYVEIEEKVKVEEIEIPLLRNLYSLKGEVKEIKESLIKMKTEKKEGWISICLDGEGRSPLFFDEIEDIVKDTNLKVLMVKDLSIKRKIEEKEKVDVSLNKVSEVDVFKMLLNEKNIEEDKDDLIELFEAVVNELRIEENEN